MSEPLKKHTFTKEEIKSFSEVCMSDAKISNGDVFLFVRDIQDDAHKRGIIPVNLGEVYFWLKEMNDAKKDVA